VIDVDRAKGQEALAAKLRERAQQTGGIAAAADPDHESRDMGRKMILE
jgi:hypothetical protein